MYQMDFTQLLFEGSYFVVVIYWGRGIVLSCFALVTHRSVQSIRLDEFYYPIAVFITICLILIYHFIFRYIIAPPRQIEKLYRNQSQLRLVAIFQTTLLAYLLFINLGRYYDMSLSWYNITYMVSCMLCFISQILLVQHSIRISSLLEFELHTQLLQKQLSLQMQHYKAYQKYTESFRVFKHDYKNMMASVKSLLSSGEYQKAERMLDTIHDTMKSQVLVHKAYSNHMLLDAILQDAANICSEHFIQFSATLFIPDGLNMPDIDYVRIFSNLIDNAIEACSETKPESNPFFTVQSRVSTHNDWLTVELSNSYSGEVKLRNGIPESTKDNKDFHGIGLSVVTEIVETLGGMTSIDVDQEKKVFTVSLLFPLNTVEKE
ncbi:sensor histidine kinase [Novisyntrophococcus fermenticellae]|uniref:sensor histidine kinase n=1 Tax=Novisyntrophococcus fermenticellae TaxID=2068655 RepID=UPI001E556CF3|nr:sensor histidine kinase [Novisyntrophococcus fermenticellae]